MERLRWLAGVTTVASLGLALAFLVWPLDEPGVTGNAAQPHFRAFGWFAYSPLPEHPTRADLRRAGVAVPQDTVRTRRVGAGAAVGAAILGAAIWWLGRPRSGAA